MSAVENWLKHFGDENLAKFINDHYDEFVQGMECSKCIDEYNETYSLTLKQADFTKKFKQFFNCSGIRNRRVYKLLDEHYRPNLPNSSDSSSDESADEPSSKPLSLMERVNQGILEEMKMWTPYIEKWLYSEESFKLKRSQWGPVGIEKQAESAKSYFISKKINHKGNVVQFKKPTTKENKFYLEFPCINEQCVECFKNTFEFRRSSEAQKKKRLNEFYENGRKANQLFVQFYQLFVNQLLDKPDYKKAYEDSILEFNISYEPSEEHPDDRLKREQREIVEKAQREEQERLERQKERERMEYLKKEQELELLQKAKDCGFDDVDEYERCWNMTFDLGFIDYQNAHTSFYEGVYKCKRFISDIKRPASSYLQEGKYPHLKISVSNDFLEMMGRIKDEDKNNFELNKISSSFAECACPIAIKVHRIKQDISNEKWEKHSKELKPFDDFYEAYDREYDEFMIERKQKMAYLEEKIKNDKKELETKLQTLKDSRIKKMKELNHRYISLGHNKPVISRCFWDDKRKQLFITSNDEENYPERKYYPEEKLFQTDEDGNLTDEFSASAYPMPADFKPTKKVDSVRDAIHNQIKAEYKTMDKRFKKRHEFDEEEHSDYDEMPNDDQYDYDDYDKDKEIARLKKKLASTKQAKREYKNKNKNLESQLNEKESGNEDSY